MKWLDKKIKAYQDQAEETFAHMQNLPPEQLQAMQQNIVQSAQGHYDPALAAALSNPETAQYLGQSQAEQLRQQQEMQRYGQKMRVLWETGTDVELTITAVNATGVTLGGQRQYAIDVQVTGAEAPHSAQVVQLIPPQLISQYAVGARFNGKMNPQDHSEVGIFTPIG